MYVLSRICVLEKSSSESWVNFLKRILWKFSLKLRKQGAVSFTIRTQTVLNLTSDIYCPHPDWD